MPNKACGFCGGSGYITTLDAGIINRDGSDGIQRYSTGQIKCPSGCPPKHVIIRVPAGSAPMPVSGEGSLSGNETPWPKRRPRDYARDADDHL